MDEWGNNPASVEAVATALAVVAVILAGFSLRESRAQRRALESEVSARMRPWVGLFDLAIIFSDDMRPSLKVLLRNFGPVPAQQAKLKLVIEPRERGDLTEEQDPVLWQEANYKALMPGEEGNYTIDLSPFVQMKGWMDEARDISVVGQFEYALGASSFESTFLATLWFSRAHARDKNISVNWRNNSAS